MKKFFQKHDLVKIAFCMIILCLILTWIIPQGYFDASNAGKLASNGITRLGIFDLCTYGLLGIYYFTVLVTFLFVLGGFYQFLSKLDAYQILTDKIATKIKGKEILFSLIISFVFAGLASIFTEYIVLIAFMPFIITILSKAKFNNVSSFVTTFGSMLVGVLGSTISPKVVGMNVQYFSATYTTLLLEKIILFAAVFVIYSIFNVLYLKKTLNDNKEKKTIIGFFIALIDIGLLVLFLIKNMVIFYILLGVTVVGLALYIYLMLKKKGAKKKSKAKKETKTDEKEKALYVDLFENNKKIEEAKVLPLIIVGILAIITIILAYVPWATVFKLDWFTNALTKVTETKLFGVTIFAFILGNVSEFGAWDIFGVQVVMLLTIIVLQICYRKSINSVIESFGEGFKKTSKLVMILLLAYFILEIAVMYPVLPTIVGKVLGAKFNVFTTSLAGLITGLFTSEYQYSVNFVYSYFTAAYPKDLNAVSFILQSTYGLVSFLAPSSALLLVGLTYLNIPFKDWFKYIWKFLVAVLVVIIIMAFIIA